MKPSRALILASPPVAAGFALAGIPSEGVDRNRAADRVRELAAQPDLGVLLVEDSVLAQLEPPDRAALDRRIVPVVVPFAGPTWDGRAEQADAYILELLRRAIGYRVRLR
ncbi:MAG: V-type ATP synthase subunit F [Gemmatimonadaceae bacterium]